MPVFPQTLGTILFAEHVSYCRRAGEAGLAGVGGVVGGCGPSRVSVVAPGVVRIRWVGLECGGVAEEGLGFDEDFGMGDASGASGLFRVATTSAA